MKKTYCDGCGDELPKEKLEAHANLMFKVGPYFLIGRKDVWYEVEGSITPKSGTDNKPNRDVDVCQRCVDTVIQAVRTTSDSPIENCACRGAGHKLHEFAGLGCENALNSKAEFRGGHSISPHDRALRAHDAIQQLDENGTHAQVIETIEKEIREAVEFAVKENS